MSAIHRIANKSFLLQVVAVFGFLTGCATQLGPSYDKAVVDGLNAVNTETMTLFATTSMGTKSDDFSTRADKYAALIGKLDALTILAGARPVPKNKVSDAINKLLDKRRTDPIAEDDATPPSAHAIRKISETVVRLRDTDKQHGVNPTVVQGLKNQATIYFDQAITYENFLQR